MYEEPPAPAPGDNDAPPEEPDVRPALGIVGKPPRNTTTTRNGSTTRVDRAEPHDWDTEAALIGACLMKGAAIDAALAAGVVATDFYKPLHAAIFDVCVDLRAQHPDKDRPAEEITVHARLGDAAPSIADLFDMSRYGTFYNADKYADIIIGLAERRALLRWVSTARDAAHAGTPFTLEPPAPRAAETAAPLAADMQAILEGKVDSVIPNLILRDDGETCLLYAPGIHWLSGEPGKGKSLISLSWVARELERGQHVLYIDFEGTADRVAAQLSQMGCADLTKLSYLRRFEPWTPATVTQLRHMIAQNNYTLAVFDAVAGAMEAENLDPESNRDAEKWVASIPMMCFAAGMAVVCVDHVVKNAEQRGRWMIGAQRKMARADAAFALEMHEEAGVGRVGHGRLLVTKDRYGALSQHQAGKTVALVTIASEEADHGHTLRIRLAPPPDIGGANGKGGFTPTWYMEQVSMILEKAYEPLGIVELRKRIGKSKKYVDDAVDLLLKLGHIEIVAVKGAAKPFRSVRPYRQPDPDEPELVEDEAW